MIRNFKIVKVDYHYCDYLRKFDSKVPYNAGKKELRPFIGILFLVNNCEYFAPLSSPKQKHLHMKNNIDFLKIADGKLGVINFNNMIPVSEKNYELFELNNEVNNMSMADIKRINLLKNQLLWLNKNRNKVKSKSLNLYTKYKNNKLPFNIKERCCNFILLEEKCKKYNLDE